MSYATALPRPDTVSITVSGPSTALAYARALAAKAKGWAGTAVFYVKMGIKALTRIPKMLGSIALSALSTRAGYDAAVTVIGKAARVIGRTLSTVVRAVGLGLGSVARFVTGLLRHVAPKLADTADRFIDKASEIAERVMTTIEATVTDVSQVLGVLVRSPLVVLSTIRAAGIASAALAIHALTKGAAAARIVQLIPRAMTAIVWLTNPWKLLLAVVGVMAGATAYAGFRLEHSSTPTPVEPAPGRMTVDHQPRVATSRVTTVPQPVLIDSCLQDAAFTESVPAMSVGVEPEEEKPHMEAADMSTQDEADLASNLRVVIAVDGSIEVHGIPASLPNDDQRRIAQTAADAAAEQLHRIIRRGRPIRSADRRHVTKAAQAAVRASADLKVAAA